MSATASELPTGLIVQYGFSVRGPNANPSLDSMLGNVVIGNASYSQNIVPFDAKDNWIGYTNVYELPSQGNAFQFGYVTSLPDLKSTLDTTINQLVIQPNFTTYANNALDPYWVNQSTGEGNKWLVASTYVEPGSTFNETDLTFSGNVSSYTLDSGYTATFFIKALDPNNSYQDVLGGSKSFHCQVQVLLPYLLWLRNYRIVSLFSMGFRSKDPTPIQLMNLYSERYYR